MKAIVPANKILNGSRWRKWRMEIFIARRNISNLFFLFGAKQHIAGFRVYIKFKKAIFIANFWTTSCILRSCSLFFFSRLFLPCLLAYRHFLSVNKKYARRCCAKISNIHCWLLLFSTFSHRSSKYNEIESLLVRKNVHCGNIDIYENISIELPVLEISFV